MMEMLEFQLDMKPARPRLDDLMVERGLADDARQARALIMIGDVLVDDVVETKPGRRLGLAAAIRLRREPRRCASRAGAKLEHALDAFGLDVRGRAVLDAGASAGGFTDVLLQRGARRVYAADVGYGQMDGRLANDPRVVNLERTNISDLTPALFGADPPEACTVDLSYLSLRRALPILRAAAPQVTAWICLVKPLFEGLEQELLCDVPALRRVLRGLLPDLQTDSARVAGFVVSPVLGGRGALEFLLHLAAGEAIAIEPAIEAALRDAAARFELSFS